MVSNQITWRIVRVSHTACESCAVLTLNSTAEKQRAVLFCSKAEMLKENFTTVSSSYMSNYKLAIINPNFSNKGRALL